MKEARTAGILLILSAVVFIAGTLLAESYYPGYSRTQNYISDLGMGNSATIFNSAIFISGALALLSALFLYRAGVWKVFAILFALFGITYALIGVFPESIVPVPNAFAAQNYLGEPAHYIVSFASGIFATASLFASTRIMKPSLRNITLVIGAISMIVFALFLTQNYLGIGPGGMERLGAVPFLLWEFLFGASLLKKQSP